MGRAIRRYAGPVGLTLLAGCLDAFPAPPPGELVELEQRDQGRLPMATQDARTPDVGPADAGFVAPRDAAVRDAVPTVDAQRPRDMAESRERDAAVDARPVDAQAPDQASPAPRARPGDLIINELDYNQPGPDEGEFIELAVTAGHAIDLEGVRVELYSGTEGNSVPCGGDDPPPVGPSRYRCVVLPPRIASPGERLVLTTEDTRLRAPRDVVFWEVLGTRDESGRVQNGGDKGDGLVLVAGDGRVLDGLAYEAVIEGVGEGEAAPDDADREVDEGPQPPEKSLSRCPDLADTDNNKVDFELVAPTPGRPNDCP